MTPGETLVLAKSLAADLEDDALLDGTPEITIWEGSDNDGWTEATADFTVSGEQVNAAALTTEAGETVAIGTAVVFTLTASETPGTYYVRVGCDADDGTRPEATPPVKLVVTGPPSA
jgi:hypothetical protein